jgi:hypothetical protein
MPGPIYQMLMQDHRRMEDLLALAKTMTDAGAPQAYEEFRSGLLRHIGMEENILIPAAHQARGGVRLPLADRLRLDHGALAALLVPPPSPEVFACIEGILSGHNLLEEGKDGLYEICEQLAGSESGQLLERPRAYPSPRLKPNVPGEWVLEATRRALSRAGYDWDLLVSRKP